MKRLVVLGGGTAGTMAVNKLRRSLTSTLADHGRRSGRQASVPTGLPVHPVRPLSTVRGHEGAPPVHAERSGVRARRDRPTGCRR